VTIPAADLGVGAVVGLLFTNRLLEAVERGQPNVVISTYPLVTVAPIRKKPTEKESVLFSMNA
jgi:hypothetical protein